MMKGKPSSSLMLALGGFFLVAMGIYFIFLQPSLLPEDLRYMKTTLPLLNNSAQGLSSWLQKVFWVMGGYIFTTGVLIIFIAFTSFRKRLPGVFGIVAFAGISSIG